MSLAVWLGAIRKCSAAVVSIYGLRVIYGAAVFIKAVLQALFSFSYVL